MWIKYRNIVRDAEDNITSGTAVIVENNYKPNEEKNWSKNHTGQSTIERLGKVLWINPSNNEQGIFNSPTRGLVFYDLSTDTFESVSPSDSRLMGTKFEAKPLRMHVNFGNAFLFFNEMEKTPYMNVLRATFQDKELYEKALAHLFHDCLKNNANIKCGEFLQTSILSHVLQDIPVSTLDCDTAYYAALSDDTLKCSFFRNLISEMRKTIPDFGRACYVDSTPLPGEAKNNPFNALSSHGTDGAVVQSRLVLILDIQTQIPVWFEIIPSNVLDKSTIVSITNDVKETLDVTIDMYDLDAGYARKELFEMFNRDNAVYTDKQGIRRDHTVLVRMPATNGYPRDELYARSKPNFYSGKYSFDYEHHTFFGQRFEVKVFEIPEYAFVFVDKTQAESLLRGWREHHLDEWNELSEEQQDWYQVKDGFFALLGNKDQTPREALIEYRGRAHIEGFFRDGKTYLKILPIGSWTKATVTGKIFHDIIETIMYRAYRKGIAPTGLTMSSLIVYMDSWDALVTKDNLIEPKEPNAQVKDALEKQGYTVRGRIDLNAFSAQILKGELMGTEPVTMRTKRKNGKGKNNSQVRCPEERLEEKRNAAKAKAIREVQRILDRALAKAKKKLDRALAVAENKYNKDVAKSDKKLEATLATAKREQTKEKARLAHEVELETASSHYQTVIAEAKALYDDVAAQAQQEYDAAVANL